MTTYIIDKNPVSKTTFWRTFKEAIDIEADENLDDWLDECNEEIHIGSLTYSASQVLKAVDPVAYRCSIDDLKEVLYEDNKYDLGQNEEVTINGHVFRVID